MVFAAGISGLSLFTEGQIAIRRNKDTELPLIRSIVGFAQDKKAEDIKVLDMRNVANFCDYFIICTGNSDRQVKAIADNIELGLHDLGINIRYKHGLKGGPNKAGADQELGAWALLDMGDVVVHVFEPNAREFYSLEYLWRDASEIPLNLKISRRKSN